MASAGMSSAQTTAKSPNEFSVNIGYNIGLKKEVPDMLLLQTEYGRHINEQFYIGAGTGIITDTKFKTAGIPLFARAEVDFPTENLTPYISFQAGYDFNVSGGNGTGNGRINPVVGVKVPVSKNNTVNLGFGYTRTFASGGGNDYLGFNTGISFNAGGRGLARFFKKFEYSMELETMLPVSYTKERASDDVTEYKYKNFIGFRFNAIMPTKLPNLYAGYSIGMGTFTEKWQWNGKYASSSDNLQDFYGNIMARARYKVKQVNITDRIYPFAQVDMGIAAYYDIKFAVNPTVGISIMTGKKQSVDISAGYCTVSSDSEDSPSKGTLRIAAGYTF